VDTYVGHTTNFTERKSGHKSVCCNEKDKAHNLKLYQNIRANGGWTNWEMMPLEEYPCENRTQARIREQYWLDKLQTKLNAIKAFLTEHGKKEYAKENSEYYKQYRNNHRNEQKEYAKQKITCECGIIYCQSNKSNHLKTKKHLLNLV
jgi:hypothetical protein